MSHFSTLRTKITSSTALIEALKLSGIEVKQNAIVRGYNGNQATADIVAVLEGMFDMGWTFNPEIKAYDVILDTWGVNKKHNVTELINSVNQKYAVCKTLEDAQQRGLQNAEIRVKVAV